MKIKYSEKVPKVGVPVETEELTPDQLVDRVVQKGGYKFKYSNKVEETRNTTFYSKNFEKQTEETKALLQKLEDEEPDITIAWISKRVGHGAFATKDIKKDTPIARYSGELLVKVESFEPYKSYGDGPFYGGVYIACTNYKYPARDKDETITFKIDAAREGNITRFVNNAPDTIDDPSFASYDLQTANVEVKFVDAYTVLYFAKRDIRMGEQLLSDYGKDYSKENRVYFDKNNNVIDPHIISLQNCTLYQYSKNALKELKKQCDSYFCFNKKQKQEEIKGYEILISELEKSASEPLEDIEEKINKLCPNVKLGFFAQARKIPNDHLFSLKVRDLYKTCDETAIPKLTL